MNKKMDAVPLRSLEKIPFGDIKKLQGVDNGYRLRIGDLRVLFSIEDDRIYLGIRKKKRVPRLYHRLYG